MVRLKAPAGCRNYSFNGCNHDVPDDGIVEVSPEVALVLQSHGFLPPVIADVHADAVMTRADISEMLGHLGIAVADSMLPTVKLAEMLKAAVKAKADSVKRAEDDLRDGAKKAVEEVDIKAPSKRQRNA